MVLFSAGAIPCSSTPNPNFSRGELLIPFTGFGEPDLPAIRDFCFSWKHQCLRLYYVRNRGCVTCRSIQANWDHEGPKWDCKGFKIIQTCMVAVSPDYRSHSSGGRRHEWRIMREAELMLISTRNCWFGVSDVLVHGSGQLLILLQHHTHTRAFSFKRENYLASGTPNGCRLTVDGKRGLSRIITRQDRKSVV